MAEAQAPPNGTAPPGAWRFIVFTVTLAAYIAASTSASPFHT